MIQAMGGLMSITGESDDMPGGGPQKVGVPIVDIMTGMYATIAVLAALARRYETGEGEWIDIGMLDVSVAMLANQAMNYLVSGSTPTRKGNKHPNIQPQDVFAVKDGHLVLAVGNDEQFRRFAKAIERPELADDPRFATNVERVRNLDILHPLIAALLLEKPLDHWIALLSENHVPCGPINTVPRVFEEEQVKHRQMLRKLKHPLNGEVPQVVSPMRFANAPLSFDRPPPMLGEHTDEVLARAGRRIQASGRAEAMKADNSNIGPSGTAGAGGGREGRIPLPGREQMSPEQQKVYDDVVKGPRGMMIGPLRAVIHSPELAARWQRLGEFVRYRTVLPEDLKELAIIVSAKRWNSEVEWGVHSRIAREGGVPDDVIAAIRDGSEPELEAPAAEIYEFTRQLQTTGEIEDATYRAVLERWGERGIVELTGIVGYYTMVAMMLNAHRVPLPDGVAPAFGDGNSAPRALSALPPPKASARE